MEQVSDDERGDLEIIACVGPINQQLFEEDVESFFHHAPPRATHWDYVREDDGSVHVIPNMVNSAYPTFVRICFYRRKYD